MTTEAPEEPPAPVTRRSTYLRSGIAALVVLAVIAFFINLLLLQRHTGAATDGGELADRISQNLQFNAGKGSPPKVSCPPSIPKTETTFTCKLEQGNGWVAVEVTNSNGRFSWRTTNQTVPPPS